MNPPLAGYLVTGYAAGTSDINVDGAFARISLAAGTVSFNATAGTSLTNSGTTNYPRDTRLTFSLVLNHTAEAQPFNGGLLPAKTMEVWYYNWQTRETVYALTIATDASTRSPAAVAFRTWSTETGVLAHFDNVKLLDGLRIVTDGFVPEDPPVPPSIPRGRLCIRAFTTPRRSSNASATASMPNPARRPRPAGRNCSARAWRR
jgi:hypothetical protein